MNISLLEKKDFEKLFSIMREAFPPEEYRPKEKQLSLLDDPGYSMTVLKNGDNIHAFIAVWKLNGFTFAEHIAVAKELRGNGVGSLFLKEYLKTLPSPLVLEVEDTDDEISRRRIGFYKRLDFVLTDIRYDQPNFQKSEKAIPLRVMYNPNGYFLDTETVKDEIFEKVYKKKREKLYDK